MSFAELLGLEFCFCFFKYVRGFLVYLVVFLGKFNPSKGRHVEALILVFFLYSLTSNHSYIFVAFIQ